MSGEDELPRLFTIVPSREPIELVHYYAEFASYYPECELQTKRWLVENALPDWHFLDIGANIGYYSILMSQLAPSGHVHAFEPTDTIGMLTANLRHHHIENVSVHRIAVGRRTGRFEEPIYRIWNTAPERLQYDFGTVDDLSTRLRFERLDCIKVDTDGFDFDVLQGAVNVLERFNPWIIVELNEQALSKRDQTAARCLAWLSSRGYQKALVLDDENYVLRRSPERIPTVAMALSFDEEPIILPGKFTPCGVIDQFFDPLPVPTNLGAVSVLDSDGCLVTPGKLKLERRVHDFFSPKPKAANQGRVQLLAANEGLAKIEVAGPQWSYAAVFERRTTDQHDDGLAGILRLTVEGGPVGVGFLNEDMSAFVGNEVMLAASPKPQVVTVETTNAAKVYWLALRNIAADGQVAQVLIQQLQIHNAVASDLVGTGPDKTDYFDPLETCSVVIEAAGPRWSHAALFQRRKLGHDGPIVASVALLVEGGAVSLGFLREDQTTIIGREASVTATGQFQISTIEAEDCAEISWLVVRNVDIDGLAARVTIHSVTVHHALPSIAAPSPLLDRKRNSLSLADCSQALASIGSHVSSEDQSSIDIVSVAQLDSALNFQRPYLPASRIQRNSLAYFDSARDEAAVYRYLFANVRPRRHLEFGTWDGHGAVVCASSCEAEIWTISVPEGEVDTREGRHYRQTGASWAGGSIGWRYRDAGFSNRVHQILCDSRELDTRQLSKGLFDTASINGRGTRDVSNDTSNAISLLRPGGFLIWQDFCPDAEVLQLREAPRGVVEAVVQNFSTWRPYFSQMFWVRPSWMLIGVRSELQ